MRDSVGSVPGSQILIAQTLIVLQFMCGKWWIKYVRYIQFLQSMRINFSIQK